MAEICPLVAGGGEREYTIQPYWNVIWRVLLLGLTNLIIICTERWQPYLIQSGATYSTAAAEGCHLRGAIKEIILALADRNIAEDDVITVAERLIVLRANG